MAEYTLRVLGIPLVTVTVDDDATPLGYAGPAVGHFEKTEAHAGQDVELPLRASAGFH